MKKMPEKEDVKWIIQQRFEFIEWRLYWVGRVNRVDLEERFDLSTPQASLDLRSYQEAAPGNVEYDATERTYVPSRKFRPLFLRLSADRYLLQLEAILNHGIGPNVTWFGSPPPASVMPSVTRGADPELLRTILKAIENRRVLNIRYQSLTNLRDRSIVPHSLAFDGRRWHARAWATDKQSFRDFVISRFHSAKDSGTVSDISPSLDIEWNTVVKMKFIPHPALSDPQKAAIEMDYGMSNGSRIIETRAALSFYLIKRLNLDLADDVLPPERKQICLENLAEVEMISTRAKEETKRQLSLLSL